MVFNQGDEKLFYLGSALKSLIFIKSYKRIENPFTLVITIGEYFAVPELIAILKLNLIGCPKSLVMKLPATISYARVKDKTNQTFAADCPIETKALKSLFYELLAPWDLKSSASR